MYERVLFQHVALGATGSASARRGLSLIEVVAATLIVGLMSVAALNSLGAATRSAESIGNRAVALGIADQLMTEILGMDYEEPIQAVQFGPEAPEDDGTRSQFDDVDDYHQRNEQPPCDRNGTAYLARDDWRQRVEVAYVDPGNMPQTVLVDQGAKQIRVTVEYDGHILADQIAVKTNHD